MPSGTRPTHGAVAAFGETGVVELIGLLGYYSLLAMLMNALEIPTPGPAAPPMSD